MSSITSTTYTIKSPEGDRICDLDFDALGNISNLEDCPTYFKQYLQSILHGELSKNEDSLFPTLEQNTIDLLRIYLTQRGFTVIERDTKVEQEILNILQIEEEKPSDSETQKILGRLRSMNVREQEYMLRELKSSEA